MPKSKPPRKKTARSKIKTSKKAWAPAQPPMTLQAMEGLMAQIAASSDEQSPVVRAQEIIYDAWEAPGASDRIKLAWKALEVSPLCADAYVILAEEASPDLDSKREFYRKGVEAGETALGEEAFEEDVGHFWGLLETRPYMRARHGLAMVLWAQGHQQEAIAHWRDMLRLNPNDNQGIRHLLAACYLELGLDEDLAKLFANYPDEGSTEWAYSRALAAYRRQGDCDDSRALFARALQANSHVPRLLIGKPRKQSKLPDYVALGSREEALCFAADFHKGWAKTPGALAWLESCWKAAAGK